MVCQLLMNIWGAHIFSLFLKTLKKPLSILICVPAQLPAWYKCLEMALQSG